MGHLILLVSCCDILGLVGESGSRLYRSNFEKLARGLWSLWRRVSFFGVAADLRG